MSVLRICPYYEFVPITNLSLLRVQASFKKFALFFLKRRERQQVSTLLITDWI